MKLVNDRAKTVRYTDGRTDGRTPNRCTKLTARRWPRAANVINSSIQYDTRCYFNVRSKADMSRLNLPHGNGQLKSVKTDKLKGRKQI